MERLEAVVTSTWIGDIRQPCLIAEFSECWICLQQVQVSLAVGGLIFVKLGANLGVLARGVTVVGRRESQGVLPSTELIHISGTSLVV